MGHDGGHEFINLGFVAIREIRDVGLAITNLVHPLFYCSRASARADKPFFKCSNYQFQAP